MAEVRISAAAAAQAEALDTWWTESRPLAPLLFAIEFERAVTLLGVAPGAGARFRRSAIPGVRRVVMQRTRNLLFYIYSREIDVVHIIAVWGGPKGTDPLLIVP